MSTPDVSNARTPRKSMIRRTLSSLFSSLSRDLRTVANDLRGVHPPPFTQRSGTDRHDSKVVPLPSTPTPSISALAPRALRVVDVIRETHDSISLRLEDPTGRAIAFIPGQFLTLIVTIGGETLRRAYSISSGRGPSADGWASVSVTVKRVQDGLVSNHLNDHAASGQTIEVLGPSGNFTVTPHEAHRRRIVLVAGGSGITPIVSIVRAVLEREPESHVALVFGNRTVDDVIFRAELDRLHASFSERFAIRHVLATAAHQSQLAHDVGILEESTCTRVVASLDAFDASHLAATDYYVCGPAPMMAATRASLLARGVDASKIHEERFTQPHLRASSKSKASGPQPVQIRLHGRDRAITVAPDQSLLEAGLGAGLPMPFSCGMGGCGACKVKLVSGTVDLEEPNCLTPQERAEGFILACSSRATSPLSIQVPDDAS